MSPLYISVSLLLLGRSKIAEKGMSGLLLSGVYASATCLSLMISVKGNLPLKKAFRWMSTEVARLAINAHQALKRRAVLVCSITPEL